MNRWMLLVCLLASLGGGAVAHQAQRQVDPGRREADAASKLLIMPSADTLRVATMDLHAHVAVVMWVRSVLEFGERLGDWDDAAWQAWFARMVDATTTLDPHWRTPFFFGGVMLRVSGNVPLSTQTFMDGHASFPDDPYFPFSVGMNYYLHDEDFDAATEWIGRAAALPGAPDWYRMAAVAVAAGKHDRAGAIRYFQSELAVTSDPQLREGILTKIAGLQHDEFSERLTAAAIRYEAEQGVWPGHVDQLVEAGLATAIPPDPLGAAWVSDSNDRLVLSEVRWDRYRTGERRKERQMLVWIRKGR